MKGSSAGALSCSKKTEPRYVIDANKQHSAKGRKTEKEEENREK
jgi:hypothetical protein